MEILRREGSYDRLRVIGKSLQQMQSDALTSAGVPHQICGDETLFDIFFTENTCRDYRTAAHDDTAQNVKYNNVLREKGVFKSPGKLYPSLAITQTDLERTRDAVVEAVRETFLK